MQTVRAVHAPLEPANPQRHTIYTNRRSCKSIKEADTAVSLARARAWLQTLGEGAWHNKASLPPGAVDLFFAKLHLTRCLLHSEVAPIRGYKSDK
ncbi:unnamed protein product [Schistocephalus solidus]|uniref:Transposase n=1 Tax=Schistocephalus solidus TaxID=70667 RepID=A0A183SVL1_SCHSO|nr:unnamed protein product [Schistocephalus solidus]